MSERAVEIVLFLLAAASLAGGIFLGLEDHTVASVAMIATFGLLAVVAGVGPKSILRIRSDKEGFEITRATPQEVQTSLTIARDMPTLPEEQIEEAVNRAESRPETERTDADYLVLAMAAFRANDPEEVLRYAYGGLSVPSSGTRIRATLIHRVASAFADLGLNDKALELYGEVSAVDPTFAWPHLRRGLLLNDLQRYDEALAAAEKAIRLEPMDPSGYVLRCAVLSSLERYDEALAAAEEAIRLEPTLANAHSMRGLMLKDLERYDEALAALDQAIRLDTKVPETHIIRSQVLQILGRQDEAAAAHDAAKVLGEP